LDRVRALGYLNDPNDLAQALIAVGPLLWPFWRTGRFFRNLMLVIVPSMILLYGVFLTHSRGAATSALVIVALLSREKIRRFRKTAPIAISILMAAAFSIAGLSGGRGVSSGDESAAGRLAAWSAGFEMLKSSPLFGVGYGAFTDFHELTAHNSFVLCLAELGVAGFFCWLSLLAVTIWELRRVEALIAGQQEYEELARWSLAVRFSLYAFLSGAFFLSRTYAPTLYITLGTAFVVVDIARRTYYDEIPKGTMMLRLGGLAAASIVTLYGVVRMGRLWMH
jgi:putative inorganic carbon (HCO3(-)) transporter